MRSLLVRSLAFVVSVLAFAQVATAQSPPADAVVFDTFTGANLTLLQNHSPDLGAPAAWTWWGGVYAKLDNGRVGPSVQDTSTTLNGSAIESGLSNGIISVEWTPGSATTETYGFPIGGIIFRYIDVNNYWRAYRGTDQKLHLSKYVAGTDTAVATSTTAAAADLINSSGSHTLEVHLLGSTIELWVHGDAFPRLTATDSFNVHATKHGILWMAAYDWGSRFDNFAVQQPAIDHLVLAPSTLSMSEGMTHNLAVQAYDVTNTQIPGVNATWTSDSPNATVAGGPALSATVTAVHAGLATITATENGVPVTLPIGISVAGTARVYDTFTGTNGTVLSSHAADIGTHGGWTIWGTNAKLDNGRVGPAAQDLSGFVNGSAIDSGIANGTVGVDWLMSPPSGTYFGNAVGGLIFRYTNATNYWQATRSADNGLYLSKWVNGTSTVVANTSGILTGGWHHLEVRLSGSAIEFWVDGTRRLHATDSFNVNATRHGVYWQAGYDWGSRFDNFAVEQADATHLVLSPGAVVLPVSASTTVAAQALDSFNAPVASASVTWTSDSANVTVSPIPGTATATLAGATSGSAVVTATTANGATASIPVTVTSNVPLVFDTFTSTDGTLLQNHTPDLSPGSLWVPTGTPSVVISGASAAASGTGSGLQAIIESGASNGSVAVDWTPRGAGSPTGPYLGLVLRASDASNFLLAGYTNGAVVLQKWVNGTATTLGTVATALIGATHRLDVTMTGSALQVSWDAAVVITTNNSFNSTATKHGLRWLNGSDTTSTYDNFVMSSPPVDHVVVTPSSSLVDLGEASPFFSAVAYDAANQVIPGVPFHWTISDPSAATIMTDAPFSVHPAILRGVRATVSLTATTSTGVSGTGTQTVQTSRTIVFDSFTDTNNTWLTAHTPDVTLAGGAWSALGGVIPRVQTERLVPLVDSGTGANGVLINSGVADAVIGVDWSGAASGTYWGYPMGGLVFRATDMDNSFMVSHNGGAVTLARNVGGTSTMLGSAIVPSAAGRTERLEVTLNGPNISVSVDGVVRITATDTFNQSVKTHGLHWWNDYDGTSSYDNFTVRLVTAPIDHVVVTPTLPSLEVGSATTLTAQAFDSANALIPGALFRWSLSDGTAAILLPAAGYSSTPIRLVGIRQGVTATATTLTGVSASAAIETTSDQTVIFDSFTGAPTTPLVNHLPDLDRTNGTWTVVGTVPTAMIGNNNYLAMPYDPNLTFGLASINGGTSDVIVGVDWWATSPNQSAAGYAIGGLLLRGTDTWNYLTVGWFDGTLSIGKVVAGNWTILSSANVQPAAGTRNRLEAALSGSTITVMVNGVQWLQIDESFNQGATRHGLRWNSNSDAQSTYDNFTVRTIVPTAVASIAVNPPAATLPVGGARPFYATALDSTGQAIPGALLHWSVSDPAVAHITATSFFASAAWLRGVSQDVVLTVTALNGTTASVLVTADASHTLVYDDFAPHSTAAIPGRTPTNNFAGHTWTLGSPSAAFATGLATLDASLTTGGLLQMAVTSGASDGVVAADWYVGNLATLPGWYPVGGLVFRRSDANNYWVAGYGFGGYALEGYAFGLWKVVNGHWTGVAGTGTVIDPGTVHHLEVHLSGPKIDFWLDGASAVTATDFFNGGATDHGLLWWTIEDNLSRFDDFSVNGSVPCVTALTPAYRIIDAGGGFGTLNVIAPAGCVWTAYADGQGTVLSPPGLGLQSPATGNGSATITYAMNANQTQPATSGVLHVENFLVGGRFASAGQGSLPDPCWVSAGSADSSFDANGGNRTFQISTAFTVCPWVATTEANWIHLWAPSDGSGNAAVAYTVDPTSGGGRAAYIKINGHPMNVSQIGADGSLAPPDGGGGDDDALPSILTAGQSLSVLQSPDKRFRFFLRSDNNLVLMQDTTVLWATNLATASGAFAVMQTDGNFVLYSGEGIALWYTSTENNPGAYLVLQDDGNVVLYSAANSALWSTGTGGSGCSFVLATTSAGWTAAGGVGAFQVSSNCAWTATSSVEWIHVVASGDSGTATASYTVDANSLSIPRSGQIFVGDRTFVVTQDAGPVVGGPGNFEQWVTVAPLSALGGAANCGSDDCDFDGLSDTVENQLALQFFPRFHFHPNEHCGLGLFDQLSTIPVLFRARYLSYGGQIHTDRIAINYTLLYSEDCGPPGVPTNPFTGAYTHQGDNEPVVVFLRKDDSGTWQFELIGSAPDYGTSFGDQENSNAFVDGRADVWVAESKHSNILSTSQCDGIHVCADPGVGLHLGLVNVGELQHQFVDNMGVIAPLLSQPLQAWSGQTVWEGSQFFGAGVILNDLHLGQFAARPSPPPEWVQVFQTCLGLPHPFVSQEDWYIYCQGVAYAWGDSDY